MITGRLIGTFATAIVGFSLSAAAQLVTPVAQPAGALEADPLSEAAALYATYHGDVTDVQSRGFASAKEIDTSLKNLGGHNPEQLTEGWMAYSALVAAQNPDFRAAVRDIEGYYGRDVLITGLKNDVRYARTLNGGNDAVSASLTATDADSRRLINAAAFVKEQAYSLQGSRWAMGRVGDSGAVADTLMKSMKVGLPANSSLRQALSSPEMEPILVKAGMNGAPSIWESVSGAASSIRVPEVVANFQPQPRVARGQERVADRITTLAAYRIIGADDQSLAPMQSAMKERDTASCLTMANLNLQQCVAAAHKHYEVPFCIGEHALADIGTCIGKVAN